MHWDEESQRIQRSISMEIRGIKVRRNRPTLRELNRRSVVYFVQEVASGLIKIGFSSDPENRLGTLQTSNPNRLILLTSAIGSTQHEKELHKMFAQYHVRGEWFRPSEALLNYIELVKEKPDQWGRKRRQYIPVRQSPNEI